MTYLLCERDIVQYVEHLSKSHDISDDRLVRVKNASIMDLNLTQGVKPFPSEAVAFLEMKYTCGRYMKQFVENNFARFHHHSETH